MTERGSAPLELALGLGLLVLPALVVVMSFAPWLEARAFVHAAAAEGARSAVLASNDPTAAGVETVEEMAAGRGLDPSVVGVTMCGGVGCALVRGGYVTVEVSVDIPLVATPWGDVGGLTVNAAHSEPVDIYRSLP